MKTNSYIEQIRQYLRENPKYGPGNIQRKFKITAKMAKDYFDYCKLLDDPEADQTIFHITNYREYERKKLEDMTAKEIAEKKMRFKSPRPFDNTKILTPGMAL